MCSCLRRSVCIACRRTPGSGLPFVLTRPVRSVDPGGRRCAFARSEGELGSSQGASAPMADLLPASAIRARAIDGVGDPAVSRFLSILAFAEICRADIA